MSEPTLTVIAVTSRFIIAVDPDGCRVRVEIHAPTALSKGQVVTREQLDAVEQQAP